MPIATECISIKRRDMFQLQIVTTTSPQVITLPTHNYYNYDYYVNWGDGSAVAHNTVWNTGNTHSYATAGTYVISLWGKTFQGFFYSSLGSADKLALRKILDVTDMGINQIDFNGCTNLAYISPNFKKLRSVTNGSGIFQGCTGLTYIPPGLFDGMSNVNTFYQVFNGCTGLTTITPNIFDKNPLVTSFAQAFANNGNLTAIPADLFKYNTQVTTFSYVFGGNPSNTHVTSIPVDLFRYNTLVTTFDNAFYGYAGLTSLPVDLFRYNIAVTSFYITFNYCTNLATLPNDLFRYNTLATDFRGTFNGNNKIQANANVFSSVAGWESTRFLNQSPNFTNMFTRSSFTGTQGTAPDLWNCSFGSGTPVTAACFGGAGNSITSLSNYASIPIAWE